MAGLGLRMLQFEFANTRTCTADITMRSTADIKMVLGNSGARRQASVSDVERILSDEFTISFFSFFRRKEHDHASVTSARDAAVTVRNALAVFIKLEDFDDAAGSDQEY